MNSKSNQTQSQGTELNMGVESLRFAKVMDIFNEIEYVTYGLMVLRVLKDITYEKFLSLLILDEEGNFSKGIHVCLEKSRKIYGKVPESIIKDFNEFEKLLCYLEKKSLYDVIYDDDIITKVASGFNVPSVYIYLKNNLEKIRDVLKKDLRWRITKLSKAMEIDDYCDLICL